VFGYTPQHATPQLLLATETKDVVWFMTKLQQPQHMQVKFPAEA